MLTAEFDIDKYGDAMKRSGEKIGERKKAIAIALELLRMGMIPRENIAKLTGLSVEELENLKR